MHFTISGFIYRIVAVAAAFVAFIRLNDYLLVHSSLVSYGGALAGAIYIAFIVIMAAVIATALLWLVSYARRQHVIDSLNNAIISKLRLPATGEMADGIVTLPFEDFFIQIERSGEDAFHVTRFSSDDSITNLEYAVHPSAVHDFNFCDLRLETSEVRKLASQIRNFPQRKVEIKTMHSVL